MLAIHDPFTRQMCDRLKTTCMGLGFVQLLQDAKRREEARAALHFLENGVTAAMPSRKPATAKRISRSRSTASVRIEAA